MVCKNFPEKISGKTFEVSGIFLAVITLLSAAAGF